MDKVLNYLKEKLKKNSTVVVACSAGPDSMFLLNTLLNLRDELKLEIIVGHVNHKLRKESDEEEDYIKSYSLDNNCVFESIKLNELKNIECNEELARKKRYDFLYNIVEKYDASYLLTAHHGDDLIETILMRITRGSNLKGYVGIKKESINDKFSILRPLLFLTKNYIVKYNDDNNIKYYLDKTNDDLKYTRNRYRHMVLPFLKNENENIHLKYLNFSEELEDYYKFVDNYIVSNKFIVDNMINLTNLNNETNFIKRKCIEKIIEEIQKVDILDVNKKQIDDILKLMDKDNKEITLQNNYKCIKDYNYLKIIKVKSGSDYKLEFNDKFENEKIIIKKLVTDTSDFSNDIIRLDSREIEFPLYFRNRKNGDKMSIKNLDGSKKIKDIFIDEKVSKIIRDDYPILVDNSDKILWIPNLKKSKFSKDKNEFYDIILKCEVK